MDIDPLPFAFGGLREGVLSSWIDEVLPSTQKIRFLVQHSDQILEHNLFVTITASPAHAYQASLYLALTLVTQKKAFFEPWDRAFPFPQFFRSLQAEAGGQDFFSLSLEDVFSPQQAEKIHHGFSVLLYSATAIAEIEQAALLSAFLLFNKHAITHLLANQALDAHVFSSPAQMAGWLTCPAFLQPWINGKYAPVFTRALDSLFGKLTRKMSSFANKKLAEFVFSIMLHRKRYLEGPVYHKCHDTFFTREGMQPGHVYMISSVPLSVLPGEEQEDASSKLPKHPRCGM